nr:hypothetical protein [Tanacetum cinerariifolium]
MELCTKLQQKVLNLETTKTTQDLEIQSLKRRVTKLERKKRSMTHELKRLYKKMFDRAFKRVNIFVDYKTELVEESSKRAEEEVTEGSSKRAGTELKQEIVKKQKINDDKETVKLK